MEWSLYNFQMFSLCTQSMLAGNKVFTLFRAENWSYFYVGTCHNFFLLWLFDIGCCYRYRQRRTFTNDKWQKRTVTPFLLISYQSCPPAPLSETDRVQSIKLPKSPHFLLLPLGFSQRICYLDKYLENITSPLNITFSKSMLLFHKCSIPIISQVAVTYKNTFPMLDLSKKTSNFYLRFVNGELEDWNILFQSASLPSFVPAVWRTSQR